MDELAPVRGVPRVFCESLKADAPVYPKDVDLLQHHEGRGTKFFFS